MAEISYYMNSDLSNRLPTMDQTYQDIPGAVIPGSSLIGGRDYLIVIVAFHSLSSFITVDNFIRVSEVGVGPIPGTTSLYEGSGTPGRQFFAMARVTAAGTPNDYQLQISGGTVGTVTVQGSHVFAIDLTDLGLVNGIYDEDFTGIAGPATDTLLDTGAEITIGDGASDYLVFVGMDADDPGGLQEVHNVIDIGGTTRLLDNREGESTIANHCYGALTLIQAPATDTLVKAQFQTSNINGNLNSSKICAIRLQAFEAAFTNFDATLVSENSSNYPIDISVSNSFDAGLSGNALLFGGSVQSQVSSTLNGARSVIGNENAGGEVPVQDWEVSNSYATTDTLNGFAWGEDNGIADAASYEAIYRIDGTANPTDTWDRWIILLSTDTAFPVITKVYSETMLTLEAITPATVALRIVHETMQMTESVYQLFLTLGKMVASIRLNYKRKQF